MTQSPQDFCPHVHACGGCTNQTLDFESYKAWKKSLFIQALGDALTIDPPLTLVPFTSRIRACLHATPKSHGQDIKIGFYGPQSREVIDMEACHILHPRLLALLPWLRQTLKPQQTVDIFVLLSDTGIDLYIPTLDTFPHDHPDLCRITTKKDSLTKRPVTLTFGGIPVSIPPGGFAQATREGEAALVDAVLTFTKGKRVGDLFAGSGAISLPLAQKGYKVHAVDNNDKAITNLTQAIRTYGQHNLTTDVRDLNAYPLRSPELNLFDTIVLDPPRPGAIAQVKEIAKSTVNRVVYVSCNPQSFARDLTYLTTAGFKLKKVSLIDQFLWTPHLESVALIER